MNVGMFTFTWPKGAVLLLGVIVLVVLVFVFQQSISGGSLKRQLAGKGEDIIFTELGKAEKYSNQPPELVQIKPIHVGAYDVLESHPSPFSEQEKIVLATNSENAETVLGILKSDNSMQVLVTSTLLKTDLAVTGEGVAVFAEHVRPVAMVTHPDEADDSEIVGEGSAEGPVDSGVSFNTKSYPQGSGRTLLYAVDLKSAQPTVIPLGPGAHPRVVGEESIIAITPEGISRINVRTSDRLTVVSRLGENGLGSGLSSDGSLAALRAEGNEIVTLYKIVGDESTTLGMLYTPGPVSGVALVDENHIFVRNTVNDVTFYSGPKSAYEVSPPVAHLKLLNFLP